MASSLINSELFKDQYSTKEMRAVFSGRAQIQSWLDCWVALAKAEAKNDVIPESAAEEIAQKAHAEDIDMDYVREGFKKTSHPLMPQIRAFTKLCSPEAGGYIHWGATTQDITDTGMILQLTRLGQRLVERMLSTPSQLPWVISLPFGQTNWVAISKDCNMIARLTLLATLVGQPEPWLLFLIKALPLEMIFVKISV